MLEIVRGGIVTITSFQFRGAILSDGTRVISVSSFNKLFSGFIQDNLILSFIAWDINWLAPATSELVELLTNPITTLAFGQKEKTITVYDAKVLSLLCSIFAEGEETGELAGEHYALARRIGLLSSQLAQQGIIERINEAVGYESYEQYLSEEVHKWQPKFSQQKDYREICRVLKKPFYPDNLIGGFPIILKKLSMIA